ncbi:hypothetical protein [Curtobacterium sp. MCLR17_039]|uniref:hypothetical protein n=1 Tax=Curtobacterium sp. MCLR17_039 TaxID=2175624 RepID=UPI0015E8D03E|nr:hypothetical protein [Curtobacterium sp. MCLR17_039]
MLLLTEALRGDWLVKRAGRWATVGGVAGTGFEAYARLLHPVDAHRTDPNTVDEWGNPIDVEHTRWRWAEVARRNGRVMHPLVQWFRISDDEHTRDWSDGWSVGQSDDGWFNPEDLAVLTTHLRAATRNPDDLVIGAWEGTGNPPWAEGGRNTRARARMQMPWPGRDMWLFSSSLRELADPSWAQRSVPGWGCSRPQQEGPYTSLIWPADHTWVVASEEDWDSTIVAGSRALVDSILADDHFEAFEVHEDDDLSWDGDLLNPRQQPTSEL